MKQAFFIFNPTAKRGKSGGLLQELRRRIDADFPGAPLQVTTRPGHAVELTRQAAEQGYARIFAIGGDGTFNEVVNGLMALPARDRPPVGLISSGTGGDFFRRMRERYPFPKDLSWLGKARPVFVDTGLVEMGREGAEDFVRRYFVNIADAGLSGEVVRRVGLSRKRLGSLEYLVATVLGAIHYEAPRVHATQKLVGGGSREDEFDLFIAVVANGRYFGGGMCIAPEAEFDDGYFDLMIAEKIPYLTLLGQVPRMYAKKKFDHPKVHYEIGTRMVLDSLGGAIPVGIDGEFFSTHRASFEILPKAVQILVP